jgi:hypothetical protein
MATTPVFGWPIPDLANTADGPDGFSDLALAIEGTVNTPSVVAYTPTWTSDGAAQPANPSSRTGFYQIQRKLCYFVAQINFGPSTNGGNGPLRVGIPFPGKTGMVQVANNCTLFVNGAGGNFDGNAEIRGGESTVLARFLISSVLNTVGYWQSAQSPGSDVNTTIPGSPGGGVYSVTNGGFIRVSGTYLVN